jgi:hypothetical protein
VLTPTDFEAVVAAAIQTLPKTSHSAANQVIRLRRVLQGALERLPAEITEDVSWPHVRRFLTGPAAPALAACVLSSDQRPSGSLLSVWAAWVDEPGQSTDEQANREKLRRLIHALDAAWTQGDRLKTEIPTADTSFLVETELARGVQLGAYGTQTNIEKIIHGGESGKKALILLRDHDITVNLGEDSEPVPVRIKNLVGTEQRFRIEAESFPGAMCRVGHGLVVLGRSEAIDTWIQIGAPRTPEFKPKQHELRILVSNDDGLIAQEIVAVTILPFAELDCVIAPRQELFPKYRSKQEWFKGHCLNVQNLGNVSLNVYTAPQMGELRCQAIEPFVLQAGREESIPLAWAPEQALRFGRAKSYHLRFCVTGTAVQLAEGQSATSVQKICDRSVKVHPTIRITPAVGWLAVALLMLLLISLPKPTDDGSPPEPKATVTGPTTIPTVTTIPMQPRDERPADNLDAIVSQQFETDKPCPSASPNDRLPKRIGCLTALHRDLDGDGQNDVLATFARLSPGRRPSSWHLRAILSNGHDSMLTLQPRKTLPKRTFLKTGWVVARGCWIGRGCPGDTGGAALGS